MAGIRSKFKKSKHQVFDIDITSLLDILVILLFFLLIHTNNSGVVVELPGDIKLPFSTTEKFNTPGIIVQVSPDKIWVENQLVLDVNNMGPNTFDSGERLIVPLFNELIKRKEIIKQVEKSAPGAKPFSGKVSIVADKTLKYSFIKKVLFTAAEAGYGQYKFVVLGEPK